MSKTFRIIRERFNPHAVVICHAIEYMPFGMRQFQVHLPEFDQYLMLWDKIMIAASERPMMSIQQGRLTFVAGLETGTKRTIILIVGPGMQLSEFSPYCDVKQATPVPRLGWNHLHVGSEVDISVRAQPSLELMY